VYRHHLAGFDQMRHAPGNHFGFAGAGTGDDEERRTALQDCLKLLFGEVLGKIGRMIHCCRPCVQMKQLTD